ncbi:MAG: T9SS type A sorting domain-containing protein [Calditrichaeota bacterium]|nr:T9SS type A sorting domain-containing protein [Calditrichota bacterium]
MSKLASILLIFTLLVTYGMAQTPGTKVDETTADWMHYYDNLNQFIYVNPADKKVHITYNWSQEDPDSAEAIFARYQNVTDGIKTDIRARAGNGNIAMGADGALLISVTDPVIAWGYYGWWGKGCFLYKETAPGSAKFDSLNFFSTDLGHGNPAELLSSRFVVDEAGVIHWIAYGGWGSGWTYLNSDDGGISFNEPVFFGRQNPAGYQSMKFAVYFDPFGGRVAAGPGGLVALVAQDQGRDVFVAESFDYGQTWPDNTPDVGDSTLTYDVTGFGPLLAPDSVNARPNQFNDAIYDKDGNLHVVFEATFWFDTSQVYHSRNPYPGYLNGDGVNGDTVLYYGGVYRERLMHWSPNSGLEVAAYSIAPTTQPTLGWEYRNLTCRSRGTNIHAPTLSYDADNDMLYVGWTQGSDAWADWVDDRYLGYTDLYVAGYNLNTGVWTPPVNMTSTPNFDERNLVFNKQVIDGKIYMFYTGDEKPGINVWYWPGEKAGVYVYEFPVSKLSTGETPGQLVDETTADWMHYYDNLNQFIYVDPSNKKVHITYNWSKEDPDSAEAVFARYQNVTDGIKTDIRARAGNGNIAMGADGALLVSVTDPIIAWGYYGWWGKGCFLYKETAPGSAKFDSLNFFSSDLGHGNPAELLSSRFVVDEAGVIHWIAYGGWGSGWTYLNSDDGGISFNEPVFFGRQNPAGYQSMRFSVYFDPFGGRVAAGPGGLVALVAQDQGRDVFVAESFDYGQTWPDNTPGVGDSTLTYDITGFGELLAPDSVNARPNQFNDAIYDKDGNLHVVFEATFWLDTAEVYHSRNPYPGEGANDLLYFGGKMAERLVHWSASTGLQVAAYSLAAKAGPLGWEYRNLTCRSRGTNIHAPTLAYDAENNMLYIGWTQGTEMWGETNEDGLFLGYTDLMAVAYDITNNKFSNPIDFTKTANFDERNLVFNKQVVDGKIYMFYTGDSKPGINVWYWPGEKAGVYVYEMPTSVFDFSTAIDNGNNPVVTKFDLAQNYPNPFNPTTTIEYSLPKTSHVTLTVYNMLGQKVKTLLNGVMEKGSHQVVWNATNEAGAKVSSGIYFYRLEGDFGVKVKKMVLVK